MDKPLTRSIEEIQGLSLSQRIQTLKERMFDEPRYFSLEQALLITESYQQHEDQPRIIQRAKALAHSLRNIDIRIDADELIVGNRTAGVRAGVVFPEAGITWLEREIETLPFRDQDRFHLRKEDVTIFRKTLVPYWKGKSLEDKITADMGTEVEAIKKVAKINQTDHAQGHICPDTRKWLSRGPAGIKREVEDKLRMMGTEEPDKHASRGENGGVETGETGDGGGSRGGNVTGGGETSTFYRAVVEVLDAACEFMLRYAELAEKHDLLEIARICRKLAEEPPETFREALQSVWFLFVILHMESNASSFSPGRMDQYLYPYYRADIDSGSLTNAGALELIEALWLKFNQIVYMRNASSARYFAGFPIGFNVAIGGQVIESTETRSQAPPSQETVTRATNGQLSNGELWDATNELSYLFLKAQDHLGLPQPNLSARLHANSPDAFIDECSRVIGKGSGMPQIFNDESIIPALQKRGIRKEDAVDYAVVGCVELSTHGNNLGWSDAAMFNLVKALELTLSGGTCLLTGKSMGLQSGGLPSFKTFQDLEAAYGKQIDHYVERMIKACDFVDRMHAKMLPSPFLSSVIDTCIEKGCDVTAGGAYYNLSGIQAIQAANVADSLAAIKKLVYDEQAIEPDRLLAALGRNFEGEGDEQLRQILINKVPKYGNDVPWVDELGNRWIASFAEKLRGYTNARGGPYHTGMYTVSAHVPMGQNVGASPDGRQAGEPLADGGLSAMSGRDVHGPTALLKSVSRIDSQNGSNGTLLNMKFLPDFFKTRARRSKFNSLLKAFVRLFIHHVQFNVVGPETLVDAQKHPENYKSLTVRVAGYTAYFTELAESLQDEIIARTFYGE